MKVKRNSWHYTLYCFFRQCTASSGDGPFEFWALITRKEKLIRTYRPSSLCKYFWFCVLCVIFVPLASLIAGLAIGILVAIVYPFFWLYTKWEDRREEKRKKAALREPGVNVEHKEPSMLVTYLKARKAKVCPLIEVVDE